MRRLPRGSQLKCFTAFVTYTARLEATVKSATGTPLAALGMGTDQRGAARTGGPVMKVIATGPMAELLPEEDKAQEYALVPVDENLFVVREPSARMWAPVTFYTLPTGETYLHHGVRATPKVS